MPLLGGAHAWANSGVKSQSRAHWAAGERSPAEILLLLLLLLLFLGGGPGDEFDAAPVSDKFFVVEAWQASPARPRVRVSVGERARRDGGSVRIRPRATVDPDTAPRAM